MNHFRDDCTYHFKEKMDWITVVSPGMLNSSTFDCTSYSHNYHACPQHLLNIPSVLFLFRTWCTAMLESLYVFCGSIRKKEKAAFWIAVMLCSPTWLFSLCLTLSEKFLLDVVGYLFPCFIELTHVIILGNGSFSYRMKCWTQCTAYFNMQQATIINWKSIPILVSIQSIWIIFASLAELLAWYIRHNLLKTANLCLRNNMIL